MPPNNLRRLTAEFIDFIRFALNRLRKLYCRPPGFTLMPQGKYLAGGLQSGCTANSTGVQYILRQFLNKGDHEYIHDHKGIFP